MDTDGNLEEPIIITMADSGNGSASSFSLTDSGDTIHQTPNYVVALHRKMVIIIAIKCLLITTCLKQYFFKHQYHFFLYIIELWFWEIESFFVLSWYIYIFINSFKENL